MDEGEILPHFLGAVVAVPGKHIWRKLRSLVNTEPTSKEKRHG